MLKSIILSQAALYARMVLLAAAGWLANQGLALYDADAGTVTLHVEQLSYALAAAGVGGLALAWRKIAVLKGGAT